MLETYQGLLKYRNITSKPNLINIFKIWKINFTVVPVRRHKIFKKMDISKSKSSVGEWLGHSLAVRGVDGSSLLTASQRCDGLNSLYT